MSLKRFVAFVSVAATVTTIGVTSLQPHASTDPVKQQNTQAHDYAHNEQRQRARLNDEGTSLQDADNFDRLRPVEPRPVDPDLKIRFPLP